MDDSRKEAQKQLKIPQARIKCVNYYTTKIYVFPILFSLAIGNVIIKSQTNIFRRGKR
jgi:hypothetical protein